MEVNMVRKGEVAGFQVAYLKEIPVNEQQI